VVKANKYHYTFSAKGDAAEEGTFASESNFKYFSRVVKLRDPHKICCGPLIFPQSAVAPYKFGVTPTELYDHDLVYSVREGKGPICYCGPVGEPHVEK